MYHYKSATVKAAKYDIAKGRGQVETRNDLRLYHPALMTDDAGKDDITFAEDSGEGKGLTSDGAAGTFERIRHSFRSNSSRVPLSRYFTVAQKAGTSSMTTHPPQRSADLFLSRLFAPFPNLSRACLNLSHSDNDSDADAESRIPVVIAMAISDPVKTPSAGDVYTAHELSRTLQLLYRVQVLFLPRGDAWYDLAGVDVLLTFLDAYDLSRVRNSSPHLVKVAWMRNWFHRWMSRPWMGGYDLLLVSSGVAKRFFDESVNAHGGFLQQCHRRCPHAFTSPPPSLSPSLCLACTKCPVPVEVFRIATNPRRFHPLSTTPSTTPLFEDTPSKVSADDSNMTQQGNDDDSARPPLPVDYVFTGNYWNSNRDIMFHLHPHAPSLSPFSGWIVGSGWQAAVAGGWLTPGMQDMLRPPVPYRRLQELYSSVSVVLDDNNHATKRWGSVNSRVFDALAVGSLVVTNGR